MSKATNNVLMVISFIFCLQSVISLKLARARGDQPPVRSSIMSPKRIIDPLPPSKMLVGKCHRKNEGTAEKIPHKRNHDGAGKPLTNKFHPC